ncbi:MAG: homoserine kinase [Opitutaceae bacterium]|jgi:homoserine kinase|nr:homoserine kinase [Opitutaceae bacterium]
MSNGPSSRQITVRIPGSTSNCGAGFDSLGLALTVYNRVTLRWLDEAPAAGGEAWDARPERESDGRAQAMVTEAARAFGVLARVGGRSFSYRIDGDVPPARGLGSSITVIGGVLAGLNALAGGPLTREQLVAIATHMEGHPDNAAAGLLGGFCVARCDPAKNDYLGTVRITLPDTLRFVVASPSVELLTKESRGVLPATLPYFDAVKSINSAAYLVAALATGDYARLREAVSDFMHEPYRLPKIRGGREAIAAGVAAGAYTGWLSGSGSSVLCVSEAGAAKAVGEAMRAAFAAAGVPSEVRDLAADNVGYVIEG